MRIVIPEGAEFVQKPEHLDPLRRLGEVVVVAGAPRDKTDLVARVRDADVVVLDYSMMDAEVLAQCPRLRFVAFLLTRSPPLTGRPQSRESSRASNSDWL